MLEISLLHTIIKQNCSKHGLSFNQKSLVTSFPSMNNPSSTFLSDLPLSSDLELICLL